MVKSRTTTQAVRDICLSFPEAEEKISHGSPGYFVRGKTFAYYTVNHHGDGRVAIQTRAPQGDQAHFVEMNPEAYYIPPYVGPKVWLGIDLEQGLKWPEVAARVREAYSVVAPKSLVETLGPTIKITGRVTKLKPEEIDPLKSKRAKAVLKKVGPLCMALPEVTEDKQFGNPVWKAGKKTFVVAHTSGREGGKPRMGLQFRVGAAEQSLLTEDSRFHIPPYTGKNGWIHLDVEDEANWDEIRSLALKSYRHFALKRMLKALEEQEMFG